MCGQGSPSDDADLDTALRLQRELFEALADLELEGEEPGEEVETVDRGGVPVMADPWAGFMIKSWPEEVEAVDREREALDPPSPLVAICRDCGVGICRKHWSPLLDMF